MVGVTRSDDELLLGEWACLGLLYRAPSHGFALAARLRPTGDVGRVWSLSRPLVYRSIDQLVARGLVHTVGEEPGIAGGNRTLLADTRSGRAQLRRWLGRPVLHLRDLRSELLLKLVLADECGIDTAPLVAAQRTRVIELSDALALPAGEPIDVVALWRSEASHAALRFLDQLATRAAE
jgi:PadR family transcriptional regulator AphA